MSFTDFTSALPDAVASAASDVSTTAGDFTSALPDLFASGTNAAGLGVTGFSLDTILPPAPAVSGASVSNLVTDLGKQLTTFFNTEQSVYSAQAAANLAKAQGEAAVTAAKQPTSGIPSVYWLVGAGLLALIIAKK